LLILLLLKTIVSPFLLVHSPANLVDSDLDLEAIDWPHGWRTISAIIPLSGYY